MKEKPWSQINTEKVSFLQRINWLHIGPWHSDGTVPIAERN